MIQFSQMHIHYVGGVRVYRLFENFMLKMPCRRPICPVESRFLLFWCPVDPVEHFKKFGKYD